MKEKMTREETIDWLCRLRSNLVVYMPKEWHEKMISALSIAIQALEQEPILDKLKVEINKNVEQESFARSVFLYEEKDLNRANKCVGKLEAYRKVLNVINNLLKEIRRWE